MKNELDWIISKKWMNEDSDAGLARSDVPPPGMRTVADLILGSRQHSFVEIGHEIISTAILSDLSRAVVSYWRKDVH